MKCDSLASLLSRTFATPNLGHKPKVKVATMVKMMDNVAFKKYCFYI